MNTGRRLPLLTEVLELPAGAGPRLPRACHRVGKPGKGMDCIGGEHA